MRQRLSNIRQPVDTTNSGLWFDKFFPERGHEQPESRRQLLQQVAEKTSEPTEYEAFFARWEECLGLFGAKTSHAAVQGRMIVGLGDESVIETAITLHHTYGLPYIPGSALKGLAASYARQNLGEQWRANSRAYDVLFGKTDDAGYVTFYDALYVPGSGHKGRALHTDVITVHHQDYYGNRNEPPADWDDPNPVPFLSATGKYLVALSAPNDCEQWCDAAFEILKLALAEEGVGAKTSSGYGRLELVSI